MDTKGNIREFESEEAAKAAGFATSLTRKEAKALVSLPKDERHAALLRMRSVGKKKLREERKRLRGVSKRLSRERQAA